MGAADRRGSWGLVAVGFGALVAKGVWWGCHWWQVLGVLVWWAGRVWWLWVLVLVAMAMTGGAIRCCWQEGLV